MPSQDNYYFVPETEAELKSFDFLRNFKQQFIHIDNAEGIKRNGFHYRLDATTLRGAAAANELFNAIYTQMGVPENTFYSYPYNQLFEAEMAHNKSLFLRKLYNTQFISSPTTYTRYLVGCRGNFICDEYSMTYISATQLTTLYSYPLPDTQRIFYNINQVDEEPEEEETDEEDLEHPNENYSNVISLLSMLELSTSNRFDLISYLSNNDNF